MYQYKKSSVLVREVVSFSEDPFTEGSSMLYKWKYHFTEMKGDVGMSRHKKEREQEDAHQDNVIYNPIPTSFFCDQNFDLLNGTK